MIIHLQVKNSKEKVNKNKTKQSFKPKNHIKEKVVQIQNIEKEREVMIKEKPFQIIIDL